MTHHHHMRTILEIAVFTTIGISKSKATLPFDAHSWVSVQFQVWYITNSPDIQTLGLTKTPSSCQDSPMKKSQILHLTIFLFSLLNSASSKNVQHSTFFLSVHIPSLCAGSVLRCVSPFVVVCMSLFLLLFFLYVSLLHLGSLILEESLAKPLQ